MQDMPPFTAEDAEAFREACRCLEAPSWGAQLMRLADKPVELLMARLPQGIQVRIAGATRDALRVATRGALVTIRRDAPVHPWTEFWHKSAVAVSGAAAGFVGVEALLVELPLSTTIMLRSIADIAKAQGENLADPAAALAVIEVLGMGDVDVIHYAALRQAWSTEVRSAARYIVQRGLADDGGPMLARLLARIASRYQIQVTELAAAEVVPIIGAVGGGLLNWMFLEHFQSKARGHFTIRRLERLYGVDAVSAQLKAVGQTP